MVAEEQWEEAQHELKKRVAATIEQGRPTSEQAQTSLGVVHYFAEDDVIEVVPRTFYDQMEPAGRRRVPRGPAIKRNRKPPVFQDQRYEPPPVKDVRDLARG